VVDLQGALPQLDLRKTLDALPPGMVASAAALDPAGMLDVQAHLAGSTAQPLQLLQEGTVRLEGVQANLGGVRPALTGNLKLRGDSLKSDQLQLVSGDNRADIDLEVKNLFGETIAVTARVSADRFELDPLLAAAGPPAQDGEGEAKPAGPAEEMGPFDLPVRADATVTVAKGTLKGLAVDQFQLHCLLAQNILTIDRLQGQLAGGSFSDTARIDLGRKGLAYTTRLSLKGLQAEPFLTAFKPGAKGTVAGTLDLDTSLDGQGTLPATFKRNLSGKGELLLRDGRLEGGELLQGLATFLGSDDLRRLTFETLTGNFRIEKGKILFDSRFSGKQVRLAPAGAVGLDESLDVKLDARLSPELTARIDKGGKVTQFLADKEGWSQVPLKVGGSLSKPRFELDARAATEQVGQQLQQKLEQKLLEKLAPTDQKGQDQPSPKKQLLEQTIKGLFGN
jgi:AsmA protein